MESANGDEQKAERPVKKFNKDANGHSNFKKPFEKRNFDNKSGGDGKFKKPFDRNNKSGSYDNKRPFNKNGSYDNKKPFNKNGSDFKKGVDKPEINKKELKIKRRQKKIGEENFDIGINIKKIWETLRKTETTEEVRKKLCATVFDSVNGKINHVKKH